MQIICKTTVYELTEHSDADITLSSTQFVSCCTTILHSSIISNTIHNSEVPSDLVHIIDHHRGAGITD